VAGSDAESLDASLKGAASVMGGCFCSSWRGEEGLPQGLKPLSLLGST